MTELNDRDEKTAADGGIDTDLEELLAFIRDARGFDFTGYKRSSLARRIRKRMNEVRVGGFTDYRDYLEINPDEFGYLFNTILINVTSFFRDIDAWRYLQREVLPELLSRIEPRSEIRIWSAGCSTGEEAYSLAIMFAEAMGIEAAIEQLKIYGTDLDEEALQHARAGVYTAKSLEPLSDRLRERYFQSTGDKFVFRPDLRRRVIFGRHDITRDAPISRLDLLVCRNALMYFNSETQLQILERFGFALREGGHLFLGKAEMLFVDVALFDTVAARPRIFRRRAGAVSLSTPVHTPRLDVSLGQEVQGLVKKRQFSDVALEAAPYAVLGVDSHGRTTAINARLRTEFGMAPHDLGRPLGELEISYRPLELRSLIEQAEAERHTVRVAAVEHRRGPRDSAFYDVHVQPLWAMDGSPLGTLITFVDVTLPTLLAHDVKAKREELETAYEELQSTNEELETTNEELQSSIEELETTNEELQSTNEELETTNEKLQTGNDDLADINAELRLRTDELAETRTFLEGVLSSIATGVVVLDGELRVHSWSRGAEKLWGLRPEEATRRHYAELDFGLPVEPVMAAIEHSRKIARQVGPVRVDAVDRLGRGIVCAVTCAPIRDRRGGVVLLMEQLPTAR